MIEDEIPFNPVKRAGSILTDMIKSSMLLILIRKSKGIFVE